MSEHKVYFRHGKKVYLRPLEEGDLDRLYRWINDPDVTRNTMGLFPFTQADEAEFIRSQKHGEDFPTNIILAICLVETGEHIGNIGLHRIHYVDGVATTGAIIGAAGHRGKGYGYDAKMVLLDYVFNTLNLRKVCSTAKSFNEASIRFNAKCGYHEEGRRRAQHYVDGQYFDEILTAVFKEDWLPLWEAYCHDWQR